MDNKDTIKNENKTSNREKYLSEKGKFKEGNPGGPGRPKGSTYIKALEQAIKEVEKEKKKSFFKRVVERAWHSDSVMIAILKKFIPDKLKQEFEGLENIKLVIEHVAKKNKGNKSL